ncbi:MAG: single-stranded DNA-binding protein [Planctomycetes bacterium]|nr:single-stranded DNA-binding protein [Planctomycetota bacterium]
MSSFNKVIVMGNLTRDPELRSTPGGTQVTEISLAVNDNYTDSQGQKQERTTFVDITVWGKQAETLCRWKKKGDPLLVEGRLQMDEWNDKQSGEKRKKLKVVATGFTFVGRGGSGEGGGGGGGGGRSQGRPQQGKPAQGKAAQGGGDFGGAEGGYDSYATSLPQGEGEEPPF